MQRRLPAFARIFSAVAGLAFGLLGAEMTFGQLPDTASMNFEGSRSMVWVMESLTAVPLRSISIVQSESPSALNSGFSRVASE